MNFDLYPGEVHALVGENGAGKSTLMLILAGVLKPDQGSLSLDGSPIHLRDPHDAQQKGISIVFQELALSLNMSVAENIFTNSQPAVRGGFIQFGEMYAQARQTMETFEIKSTRAPRFETITWPFSKLWKSPVASTAMPGSFSSG